MQKKVKARLLQGAIIVTLVATGLGMVLYGMRQSIVFFYTPTQILQQSRSNETIRRLGGLVKQGSIRFVGNQVHFVVTDYHNTVPIVYQGALPSLFRAGQGVVCEGTWQPQHGVFKATRLLVKHDENYRPPKPGETVTKYTLP